MTTPKAVREQRPTSPLSNPDRNASITSLNTALNKNLEQARSNESSSSNRSTPPSTNMSDDNSFTPKGMMGNPPKPFQGDSTKLLSFFQHCDMYFMINQQKFQDDDIKINIMASYFEGEAEKWFRPYFRDRADNDEDSQEDDTKEMFSSYKKFKKHVTSAFGGPNEVREAEKAIMNLRQTGSVRDYATKLRGHIAVLGWADSVTMPIFREGLKPGIKWEIRNEKSVRTLSKLVEKAIEVDNDIQDLKGHTNNYVHLGRSAKPNQGKARQHKQPYFGPMPMDLDAANKKRNYTKGPLTQPEKDRRIKNNLCLYCGKPGHVANDCFAKKGKKPSQKGKPKQFGMAEPKEPERSVTWADTASDPGHPEHTTLHWSGCYHDECLTHKADKDYCYYPKRPSKKVNKVKQRSQTPMPTNRALCCADGPKAEVITMDDGKMEVTGYTLDFIHVKTYHYIGGWCTKASCEQRTRHQHTWYAPEVEKKDIPAFTKLAMCKERRCPHQDAVYPHAHQDDNSQQRTLTVDNNAAKYKIIPALQMSDVNFPTCELDDEPEGSYDENPEPEPYPDEVPAVDNRVHEGWASADFLCPYQRCGYARDLGHHRHLMHYDPRDMTRPFKSEDLEDRWEEHLCKHNECPYTSSIGAHLHWTKNE